MKKSWLERNPRWKIPAGLLTVLSLIIVFGGILLTIVTASFRSSDVYHQALASASENHIVRSQIGEPIRPGWLISGQLNVSGSTGDADLSIPISGPKGKGEIRAVAVKAEGVWHFTSLEVSIRGQDATINLLSVPPVQPQPDRD